MEQKKYRSNSTKIRKPNLIRSISYIGLLALGISSNAYAQQKIEFHGGYIKEEKPLQYKTPSFRVEVKPTTKSETKDSLVERTYSAQDTSLIERVYSMGDSIISQNLVDFLNRGRIGNVSFLEKRITAYMQRYVENQKYTISKTSQYRDYFEYASNLVDGVLSAEQLQVSAVIESGGDPDAVSEQDAVGIAQFIEGTAKRYGLIINDRIGLDQRRDPLPSIKSKAQYLRDLTEKFDKDIPLAIAAYNCGEGVIDSIIARLSRRYDRQGIDKGQAWRLENIFRYLPYETQGHVVAFLANLNFLNILIPGVDYKVLPLHSERFRARITERGDSLLRIAKQEGRSPSELKRVNRHIRAAQARLPPNITVYVPKQQ